MEEKAITAIRVVPFALILGTISAVLSFIVAVLLVAIFVPFLSVAPEVAMGLGILVSLGGLLIIVVPILAFISTFIGAAIFAVLYNFLAPQVGGIRLRFVDTS